MKQLNGEDEGFRITAEIQKATSLIRSFLKYDSSVSLRTIACIDPWSLIPLLVQSSKVVEFEGAYTRRFTPIIDYKRPG